LVGQAQLRCCRGRCGRCGRSAHSPS
jgi:hypothetical protein